jgi:hypothetical protein
MLWESSIRDMMRQGTGPVAERLFNYRVSQTQPLLAHEFKPGYAEKDSFFPPPASVPSLRPRAWESLMFLALQPFARSGYDVHG